MNSQEVQLQQVAVHYTQCTVPYRRTAILVPQQLYRLAAHMK